MQSLDEVIKQMKPEESYIVVTCKNSKQVGDLIAKNYGTRCYECTGYYSSDPERVVTIVISNRAVEDAFTMDDEKMEASCEELSCQLPFRVTPDDFEF